MDVRERYLLELNEKLVKIISNQNDLEAIISAITISLEKYEISERSTDIVPMESTCENLLQLYACALLTEGKSKETVRGYVKFLRRFRNEVGIRFLDVKTMDVRIWLAKMQSKVSLRTCENYRFYLSAFYSWLKKEEYAEKNPMDKIKAIKYVEEIKRAFSDVEIDKIRLHCENKRNRAIFELLLSSGIRVSELCGLDKTDIDIVNKSVHVRNGKGGKQRIVYITDLCITYLNEYLDTRTDDLQFLFITKQKQRMTAQSVRTILKAIENVCDVSNIHPHRCRRTFATKLAKNGMSVQIIMKLMGHSDINTTLKYIVTSDDTANAEFRRCA